MLLNLLYAGKKDIESAIRWQGLDLELEIVVKDGVDLLQKDIKRLKEVFEDIVVISKR